MPFRDVAGHGALRALLSRAIQQDSLPPSLIFSGPEGVGKRLVAVSVAQMLNCTGRRAAPEAGDGALSSADACGTCVSCVRIARGVHPDVLLLEPGESGSIKTDVVRGAIDRSGYRPFEGRRRVVIVDNADTLVPAAQNALLKSLEEPPSSSVFILVTARPDVLIDTVRSRCPVLRFGFLDAREVAGVLVKLGRSEPDARAAAALSDGSVRRALDVSAGDLAEIRDAVASVLAEVAASDDPRRRLDAARDLLGKSAGRDQLAVSLRAMAAVVRDVVRLSVEGSHPTIGDGDAAPLLPRLAAYRGTRGVQAFGAIDRALAALDRNAGVKIVADWVAMQL